jgi:FkbM family methyltransferase
MTSIKAHTSIIGETGYNCHSRNFFKALNQIVPVSVRNWTVGESWAGYNNDEPHNSEYYMDRELKTMLMTQSLTHQDGGYSDYPLYLKAKSNVSDPIVNIVLNDTNHSYFNESYPGPSIAYNVWETTRQPADFFEKLKKFDQVWVPSEWQRVCTIEQGIPANKVKVVPEGVDIEMFKPISNSTQFPEGRPFRFVVVGRWEYRKSTKEIIKAFIETFSEDEKVELVLSVDNRFANDGLSTTEDRLAKFGLSHAGIKIVHHQSKEDYVKLLQSADVFVSCARSEGWNLPLIEAMASGIPAMYSNWGAQLQFAQGKGIPVNIHGEVPAGVSNDESWDSTSPGNFAEPDFGDLKLRFREVYDEFELYKERALADSEIIRDQFTWANAAQIACDHIQELLSPRVNEYSTDFAWVTCGNLNYMPIIEKLVNSLGLFSNRKIIVYGIGCEVPFSHPNLIAKTLTIPFHSVHDKWYWKQYACLASLTEDFENFIWLDGDIIANHTIDNISNHFSKLTDYPIPDVHVQADFIGFYNDETGQIKQQLFNEVLCNRDGIDRLAKKAHICMYVYNKQCDWWFNEILDFYKTMPLEDYSKLLQWNDEGIDNYLRCKYTKTEMLPISNFDVSEYDGDLLGRTGKAMEHFISFWRDRGPKNFGKIYGWQFVPQDKSTILYFHGNKDLEFATFMTDYVKAQRDNNFHDTKYFFTEKNYIKNLGSIQGVPGGTMDIAHQYGWDYAIFHEIYNLTDYEHPRELAEPAVKVRPGDVVVDLGGNIGIFTRYAHHMGASKIVTFEPDRRYFEILKQNAPAQAILFNAAIGDKPGTLRLTESEHLGGSNLWHQPDARHTQYEVNVYTLDSLLENGVIDRIDFLKVDIEGSEIIALQGISDENLSKIRNIAVEYHHEHLYFNDELRNEFVMRFRNLGFHSYMLLCGHNNALQLIYFWK